MSHYGSMIHIKARVSRMNTAKGEEAEMRCDEEEMRNRRPALKISSERMRSFARDKDRFDFIRFHTSRKHSRPCVLGRRQRNFEDMTGRRRLFRHTLY